MAADVTVSPTLGHAVLMTQGGVGATPGYDAIDLRRMVQAASGGQEGTFDATSWKVSENGGGANMTVQVAANVGLARVDGESVTHQGPYVVAPHSAVITLDVAAAHSTNPRVDMVILHVRDNTHDALGANDARVRILSGTATAGATLTNLNGQASLPSNSLRLADVLVPAADTTISNSQIRDRRLWARGIYNRIVRNANAAAGSDYTTTSTTPVIIDGTNLQPRVECSGAPLRCTLRGAFQNTVAGALTSLTFMVDGTVSTDGGGQQHGNPTANVPVALCITWDILPAAGSHTVGPSWAQASGSGSLLARAAFPVLFTVEEIIRQNSSNGTV